MPTEDFVDLNDPALCVEDRPNRFAAANSEHARTDDQNAHESTDTNDQHLSLETKEYESYLDELNGDETISIHFWDSAT